jgi:hypothetical protein
VVRVDAEDPAVGLGWAGVVGGPVVDHLVRAERAREIELVATRHAGHMRAARLGDLDCERPHIARRAHDQDAVPLPHRAAVAQAQALQGQDRRVRRTRWGEGSRP